MAARTLQPILAQPGDPYVTHTGEIIQPEPDFVEAKVDDTKVTPQNFKPLKKRTLKELPAPVNIINGVAAVFMYSALGVGDREICKALKIEKHDLDMIRKHSAYAECFEVVSNEFISASSSLISARLQAYSGRALDGVAEIAFKGKKEEVKLRANQDLLDRAGHTPKLGVDRAGMSRNELRIVLVDGEKQVQVEINGEHV